MARADTDGSGTEEYLCESCGLPINLSADTQERSLGSMSMVLSFLHRINNIVIWEEEEEEVCGPTVLVLVTVIVFVLSNFFNLTSNNNEIEFWHLALEQVARMSYFGRQDRELPPVLGNPSAFLVYVAFSARTPHFYLALCMHRNAISETCRSGHLLEYCLKLLRAIYIIIVPFLCPFHPPPFNLPHLPLYRLHPTSTTTSLGIDPINCRQPPF